MRLLDVRNLSASYGKVRALFDCSLAIAQNEFVVLLGANGAGKTTLLRALSGTIRSAGEIAYMGSDLQKMAPERRLQRGLAQIPQGRGTFTEFTVDENLTLGATIVSDARQVRQDKERWYNRFPRLRERRSQLAGNLSGGEQQMLAVARALMSRPKLLLCDEPSLGLAPVITREIFAIFKELRDIDGLTLLVVEQNADLSLKFADRAYVIEAGHIVAGGSAGAILADEHIQKSYLGD
ncbi:MULTISPECIES: ABC transporter ATP-binding protein [unclassified Mesorhizobium]|uniref:ABC transporter ATP-binding protein n=1 Tax=unclassified Mesorhizobium TaxID=325217 RepID=UPI000FCA47BF|nr:MULTISPECIES: ABC transporter ATP-binding protein [unclassified Mesorhizobium]RUW00327.1 ABC transporter ATP-binding protein [Mesorhizobium sp. M1A.F.Ca.IN.020.04.1.1]RUW16212.1 ABC transporter ATP-binding protein [Mesorhizobium sp. M1A.F.Ca.IN.020.03.1.1]RWF75106.1 MAG: ABC transporter ATP-binding protein [Mesorhizobium sp.]RWG14966.1 MAG: ABC transporter ATP-binding protein [Mesorhizobium sp.]RWG32010.1 MAG: ABC transporter ATP-binding protein [Mesorhizobium sp.]